MAHTIELNRVISNDDVETFTQILTQNPAILRFANQNGRTLFHTVALHGNLQLFAICMRWPQYFPRMKTRYGEYVIHYAVRGRNADIVELVLCIDTIPLSQYLQMDCPPLHLPELTPYTAALLLRTDPTLIEARSTYGFTPYAAALRNRAWDTALFFRALGADTSDPPEIRKIDLAISDFNEYAKIEDGDIIVHTEIEDGEVLDIYRLDFQTGIRYYADENGDFVVASGSHPAVIGYRRAVLEPMADEDCLRYRAMAYFDRGLLDMLLQCI